MDIDSTELQEQLPEPLPQPTRVQNNLQGPSWMTAMVLSAMAGGMGWGIRGQYGHETGAMIAGLLVSLVLVFLFCPRWSSLPAARAVAMVTIAISFGGSMTYGQTVGLTHDGPLIGNRDALRWGLLGLFIKGGIWIGFAGAFLGMSLSKKKYTSQELALLMISLIFLLFLGVYFVNEPFRPESRELPLFYFSDHWNWEPDTELVPRRERWGGLLFALSGLLIYVTIGKKDTLAGKMTLWGFLAGGIGFSLGQCIQAAHAWNREAFHSLFVQDLGWDRMANINWWNMMETTFGAVFGAILALGLWLNRRDIQSDPGALPVEIPNSAEWLLAGIHVTALATWNFYSYRYLDFYADLALTMGILPIVAITAGRIWPYLLALPITALPIAGKTLKQLCYEESSIPIETGWGIYMAAPLGLAVLIALYFGYRKERPGGGKTFLRCALLFTTWLYFSLNWAFFHFPWPWEPWTSRTPNGIFFAICAIGLTLGALFLNRRQPQDESPKTEEAALSSD